MCHGHILNTLFDCLFNLYTDNQSTMEILKALEFNFYVEEEGTNKFIISKYFNFKMIYSKPIVA